MSACASPAEPVAIEIIGNWRIISHDKTHKRATATCTVCGSGRELAIPALEGGIVCPGCMPPRFSLSPATGSRAPSIAELEIRGARGRHRGAPS
jgi:hypothetical protein